VAKDDKFLRFFSLMAGIILLEKFDSFVALLPLAVSDNEDHELVLSKESGLTSDVLLLLLNC
jgi:hypothetical protein